MLGLRICGDMRDVWWVIRRNARWDMRDMRDGPPPRNRPAGLPFFGPPPPIHERRETGTANDQRTEKRMLILYLTC